MPQIGMAQGVARGLAVGVWVPRGRLPYFPISYSLRTKSTLSHHVRHGTGALGDRVRGEAIIPQQRNTKKCHRCAWQSEHIKSHNLGQNKHETRPQHQT